MCDSKVPGDKFYVQRKLFCGDYIESQYYNQLGSKKANNSNKGGRLVTVNICSIYYSLQVEGHNVFYSHYIVVSQGACTSLIRYKVLIIHKKLISYNTIMAYLNYTKVSYIDLLHARLIGASLHWEQMKPQETPLFVVLDWQKFTLFSCLR